MELNCDMGERREAIADGTQESLMPFLTSVNIACGGHAGDEAKHVRLYTHAIQSIGQPVHLIAIGWI